MLTSRNHHLLGNSSSSSADALPIRHGLGSASASVVVDALVQVGLERAVQGHVGPKQRRQATQVPLGEPARPPGLVEDPSTSRVFTR